MLDCVLISRNDTFRRQVTELLARPESNAQLSLDISQSAEQLSRETVARIVAAGPQVAFLDLGESTTGIRVVRALGEDAPDVVVLVSGPSLSADDLLEVMRGGAAEYLPQPLGDDDVARAFTRLRRRLGSGTSGADVRGKAVGVASAKGGTGVTTLAANLAVLTARRTGEPTLLLDLNRGPGTAEVVLGLQPRYSYLDVVQNFHRLDTELLDSFLETHESGVALLAAPAADDAATRIGPEQAVSLLRMTRRHFPQVVVDAGSRLDAFVQEVLCECDDILLVVTPEVGALRNLKRAQGYFRLRNLADGGAPRLILNMDREGTGVSRREVEEVLADRVSVTVEHDPDTVVRNGNLGTPSGEDGRSRFARGMSAMGDQLLGTNGRKSGGRLSFLKSFRPSSSK